MKLFRHQLKYILAICATLGFVANVTAQKVSQSAIKVVNAASPGSFRLFDKGHTATIITDSNDAEVVQVAAEAFSKDVSLISGNQPTIEHAISTEDMVIAGTIGKSKLIDELIKRGKIDVSAVKDKWETFSISVVNNPYPKVAKALVITGSDPRGTAFGLFELSRKMGVSPLVWWADVKPKPQTAVYITPGKSIVGPPSVKYRGIFINDEDWGMQPWAAKNMDTDVKDIGPRTYEKIFELLLRLKANYIWPAMHPCTKAFWYYKEDPILARKYDIVLGASHCEPMLRNNVFEWADNYSAEYGSKPGEWRYDVNQKQIYNYWDDRVKESTNNDAVYTVGMRGIHDGSMPGPKDKNEKVKLLEKVINDQRGMLMGQLKKPAVDVPQIFCPYKEVLNLYQAGMKLPDDVTIAWADDNYGYIRQLSNPTEQKRSGRSGVYYHLSYWGSPADYLWLSTQSPSLISFEMSKAYEFGADRLWIFNVGDLKPAEMEIQFSMDLAWDKNRWSPEHAPGYAYSWAAETFGQEFAKPIADIKATYYRLAAEGKPEHIDALTFDGPEMHQRRLLYQQIAKKTEDLYKQMPERLKDAYFELILYPVEGSRLMNEKIFNAKLSRQGLKGAAAYADSSKEAYDKIQALTEQYNHVIANGKWSGMMSSHPRDQKVFKMPEVGTLEKPQPQTAKDSVIVPVTDIPAEYQHETDNPGSKVKLIKGLGINGAGLTVLPLTPASVKPLDLKDMPYADYSVHLPQGAKTIEVRCLPTFHIYDGLQLRYGISVNGSTPQFVSIATNAETKDWSKNVLRGYASGETKLDKVAAGDTKIRIYFADPGLVLNSIVVR